MPDINTATAPPDDDHSSSNSQPEASHVSERRLAGPGYCPLNGPDVAEGVALGKALLEYFKPQNVIEKILVSDFLHNEVQLRQTRKMAARAFAAARPISLSRLNGISDDRFSESPFARGGYDQGLQDLVNKGYEIEDLDAYTAMTFAAPLESLDKRGAMAELRRNQALSALEERRAQQHDRDRTIDGDTIDVPAITTSSDA